jgi:alkanesulfonate monooxygenase SsuD/methylene tetrahydromethanopterin reductase-like flavin-dependent oxidoreductase (luciferase family)
MIFDLFHSISDPVVKGKRLGATKSLENFLSQVELAENLGMDTVWCAESHFSSEVQKKTSVGCIPEFFGEVGVNCDSFQLFHLIHARTKRINLGTGIHNIVGGSGGPIASADRVNFLSFANENFFKTPRELRIGVASGRFPYQNTCFGVIPRDETEKDIWPVAKRLVFLEALEIFLRLLSGETLKSENVTVPTVSPQDLEKELKNQAENLRKKYVFPLTLQRRWEFESLKLVPEMSAHKHLQIVLGSSDPAALDIARRYWDVDLFNLSFTPPEQIEKLHAKMAAGSAQNRPWHRSRLPRTVLIFIDPNPRKAEELAHFVLDTYIEAMRGTAQVPDKKVLLERALMGDAAMVREQLSPENPRKFHADDRLMLWFEFNQLDNEQIQSQMKYFFNEVVEKL